MERHHGVTILDEALDAAVRLSQRYIPARQLPDKAVSLLDTAAARVGVSQHATPARVEDARSRIARVDAALEAAEREQRQRYADGAAMAPLAETLDPDAYRRIHQRFFEGAARPMIREEPTGGHLRRWLLRHFSATRGYAEAVRFYKRLAGVKAHGVIGDYEFLRRVALISLLQESLPAFEAQPESYRSASGDA